MQNTRILEMFKVDGERFAILETTAGYKEFWVVDDGENAILVFVPNQAPTIQNMVITGPYGRVGHMDNESLIPRRHKWVSYERPLQTRVEHEGSRLAAMVSFATGYIERLRFKNTVATEDQE